MGKPFMPWQQYVADVATERLPDPARCGACAGTWNVDAHVCPYAYQVVIVSVPRQSGKTTLLGALLVTRCLLYDGHAAFYTAQTGKDARARWADLVKLVASSPLRSKVRVRRSQGSERLELPNHSVLQVFAPTEDSLHGYTPPTVCLDEAYAHNGAQGDALMGAIEPAQQTLVDRQLWLVSTRGTAESVFLHEWIERGLAGTPGVALFDWGAAPHHDPRNPSHVLEFHPAVGLPVGVGPGTTVETIVSSKLPEHEYERAYGNRATVSNETRIPPDVWRKLGPDDDHPQTPPGDRPVILTYDVAHDRTSSTVSATWRDDDGKPQHKLVRWGSGVSWVAETVVGYCETWPNVVATGADDTGPCREVTDQLRGYDLAQRYRSPEQLPRTLTARELTVAWGELLEAVRDSAFGHDGSQQLQDAAAGVVARPVLDAESPSRRHSPVDIAPLMACMVGLFLLARTDDTPQEVVVRFG
jgi:hypothetical protein